MDINFLQEFNQIVWAGSISKAARALNMDQSVLSRHLKAAEDELGVRLLERSGGSQSLSTTVAGAAFANAGVQMLSIWYDFNLNLTKAKAARRISIGSSNQTFSAPFVSLLKKAVAEERSDLEIAWVPLTSSSPMQSLRDGEVDILIEPYSTHEDNPAFITQSAFSDRAAVVLEENDELANKDALHIDELQEHRFLFLADQAANTFGWLLHDLCNSKGFSPKLDPKPLYQSDIAMLIDLLEPGFAMFIPYSLGPHYASVVPHVKVLPIESSEGTIDMRLWVSKNNRQLDLLDSILKIASF